MGVQSVNTVEQDKRIQGTTFEIRAVGEEKEPKKQNVNTKLGFVEDHSVGTTQGRFELPISRDSRTEIWRLNH